MSFMFNPHPYDDYTPVNRPAISNEIKGRTTFGAEKVMKALSGAISKQKAEKGSCIVAIEGYPSADFEQFANGVTCLLKGEKVTLLPTTDLCLPADVLEEKLSYNLPTDRVKDPVLLYGRLFHGKFADLMDAEKVASCIDLIRNLGFQAIISATNDKIQNYLENVDKTFVYANPNKKNISIQEFEKCEFDNLVTEE